MKTVLVYRLGSLGDTVVALPCFHKIAERYPDARRVVLTNKPVSRAAPRLADVLGGSGLVHETIEYRFGTRSVNELVRLRNALSRLRIDQAIYLAAPRGRAVVLRDLAFFRLCGIRRMIGAPTSQDLLNNRVDPQTGEEEYECERLARCMSGLGSIDLQARTSWDLHLTAAERHVAETMLAPLGGARFIAINMGGKQAQNDWGHENWRELLGRLSRQVADIAFVFIGGAQDEERAGRVAGDVCQHWLNLCGKLSPRETAAVLSKALLFVGHDSGPLHLAAASDARCIGLFNGASKAHKWHPFGSQNRVFRFDQTAPAALVQPVNDAILEAIR